MTLLTVNKLNLSLIQQHRRVPVLKDISLDIIKGETLGVVGESGSGKSMLMRSLLGVLPGDPALTFEHFHFDGNDIPQDAALTMRPHMAMVLQDPKTSLNPVMTVEDQIKEAFILQGEKNDLNKRALKSLEEVSIDDGERVLKSYPFELSGGMGQRVMIAMMLALKPKLLIADEPTSALDAHVQNQILELLKEKATEHNMTLVMVSHDLPLVSKYCDRVAVMYQGRIVETCTAQDLSKSAHPYTKGLLGCLPTLQEKRARLSVLDRSLLEQEMPS